MPKNLSENRNLGEEELSIGQMKESKIILHLLLPAHHDPSSRTIARDELLLVFLFTPTAHVRLVMPRKQFLVDRSRRQRLNTNAAAALVLALVG
jgi:hypothetical protein